MHSGISNGPPSASGLGCAKTPAVAPHVEISPGNCIPESQIILHTRGSMTCWRIVFSTFCGCMSFYIGSVKSRPGAMSPPMSGLPESRQSGVLLDHLVGAGPGYSGGTSRPRAREVFRLIMRLNWSAARSVAHPAACLLSGPDHLRDYRHAPFPVRFIAAVQVELHPKNPEGCHPAYQTTCLPEPLDLATR